MKGRRMLALAFLLAAPTPGAAQGYVLDTQIAYDRTWEPHEFWDGGLNTYWADFIDGALAGRGAYGQSFTLSVGSTLQSISMAQFPCFYNDGRKDLNLECAFRMFVQEWEDTSPRTGTRGRILWEGPEPTGSAKTVHPNVWLEPGKYVAYLLPGETPPLPGYTGRVWSHYVLHGYYDGSSGPFSGGELIYFPDPRTADAQDPDAQWRRIVSADVAHFRAELTTTPEPASMALLATGLAGIAGAGRRKRRREAAAAAE